MEDIRQFQKKVSSVLETFPDGVLSYNEKEFWMIRSPYEYIEFYAAENHLYNTSIALVLARGLHDGSYRKSMKIKNGEKYRLPYVIHPLMVTRMLIDLNIPLSKEEEDILLAASLCHDMIEDIPFEHGGAELYTCFQMDKRVYETVLKVSKRRDFTEEEIKTFFHNIETHRLALLVKLSDRGNNVEDLYNMSVWKVHEYVEETNRLFLPMCTYGRNHYPELGGTLEILQDKLISLTSAARILVDRYEAREKELTEKVKELQKENEQLRRIWKKLWAVPDRA